MAKTTQLPLFILVFVSIAVAPFCGAAENGKVEFTPAAIASGSDETTLLCGAYFNEENDEQGYWFWKVDGKGKRVWSKMFPAAEQEELIALSPLNSNSWMALGQRFVDSGGYSPFIRSIDADGNAGEPVNVDAFGMSHALLQLIDGSWLLAGSAEKNRASSSGAGYDAWLLKIDSSGKILWQKWFDKGADEAIFAVLQTTGGGFTCLANSGKLDKFGSGTSEAWLFKCSADGVVQQEATVPRGRFVTKGGVNLLVRNGDRLAVACSLPQPTGTTPSTDEFTFPALIVSFSESLELKWKIEMLKNHSLSTPLLVERSEQGYLAATAAEKCPVLTEISLAGKVANAIQGKRWSFDAMMMIEALIVDKTSAYILGSVSDFASDTDDGDHVFLTKFDTSKKVLVWQEKY